MGSSEEEVKQPVGAGEGVERKGGGGGVLLGETPLKLNNMQLSKPFL